MSRHILSSFLLIVMRFIIASTTFQQWYCVQGSFVGNPSSKVSFLKRCSSASSSSRGLLLNQRISTVPSKIHRRSISTLFSSAGSTSTADNRNATTSSFENQLVAEFHSSRMENFTNTSTNFGNDTFPQSSDDGSPTTQKANFDATELLAIDPAVIEMITVTEPDDEIIYDDDGNVKEVIKSNKKKKKKTLKPSMDKLIQGIPFVSMFRGSANYIANHRNTLAVYHIPGALLDLPDPTDFQDLMNDIALTWLLGMRIVLVVGCRHQIEKRVKRELHFGLSVTDPNTLRIVKEEAGYVRFEVERQLARSLRMQGAAHQPSNGGGGGNGGAGAGSSAATTGFFGAPANGRVGVAPAASASAQQHYDGNVVSGNFYSAQPFGILDGVDYQYTGFVRKIEVNKIRQLHNNRDICLLTSLGVSPSGEVFNVNSESLAAIVAGTLGASKIIYFTEKDMELRHKIHGNKIQNLRLRDAKNLLKFYDTKIHKRGFVTSYNSNSTSSTSYSVDGGSSDEQQLQLQKQQDKEQHEQKSKLSKDALQMLLKIGWSMQAIELGVKRAHIVSPNFGAVLQELYTRDGSGTLISGDLYEGIRRSTVNDVSGIHELIEPLIKLGKLVDRPKATLEKDINDYYVYTRDNHIVACGQMKLYEPDGNNESDGGGAYAEIGCLVVSSVYRSRGRGDAMLGYLERLALMNGCSTVFVLSTQTMEWFLERGFEAVGVDRLPLKRQATYNFKRASKIYMKAISSSRDLDASELWWNR